jgi:hypothetical protein
MTKYPDFFSVLIGPSGAGFFCGYVVIAYICATAIVIADVSMRDPNSGRTPTGFSFKFFLMDNALRVLANLLLIPIFVRICLEYMSGFPMLLMSVGIGFGIEGLALLGKRLGLLTTNKLSEWFGDKLKSKP